jgi:hypothetical protein
MRDRRPRSYLVAGAVAIVAVLLAGCSFFPSTASFRLDTRLTFVSPAQYAVVRLPVSLSWRMRDFTPLAFGQGTVSDHSGYFALFVDQTPIAPGQTMRAVAQGDSSCNPHLGCPNAQYLAEHEIYTTTATHFTLPQLAVIESDPSAVQLHTVTVVLMDSGGHRIGESAWTVSFKTQAPAD